MLCLLPVFMKPWQAGLSAIRWNLRYFTLLDRWGKDTCKHSWTAKKKTVYLRHYLKQQHRSVSGKNNLPQRLYFMMYQKSFLIGMCMCTCLPRKREGKQAHIAWNHENLINIHGCKQLSKDRYTVLNMIYMFAPGLKMNIGTRSQKLLNSSEAQCCRKLLHIYIFRKPTGWFGIMQLSHLENWKKG
jgi:hypothetical protein